MLCRLSKMTGDFGRCESGAGTVLGLFTFMSVATIGAIALDVTYLRATKDQLQIAADQAAHAALYRRSTQKHEQARADAVDLTDQILGGASFKGALTTTDIEFGTFLSETRTFTADPDSKTAVRVVTSLDRDRNNAANTFLFRMIGIEDFELRAETIFATYRPGCLREGFIAEGVVDMQSNNSVLSGFCIHSNSYVSLNQNNYFQPGTIVGMPNVEDLDLPKSGFERND
ncbi:pilus assembly protein TadG-related protein, partial [Loktanella sp. SALINAS62]|uniref:pilus assembly protein TadG-related protein n=1 Tax=Loktanella sp. SALINAS62 TaxID=2706124 RepID=UPI0020127F65